MTLTFNYLLNRLGYPLVPDWNSSILVVVVSFALHDFLDNVKLSMNHCIHQGGTTPHVSLCVYLLKPAFADTSTVPECFVVQVLEDLCSDVRDIAIVDPEGKVIHLPLVPAEQAKHL